MTENMWSLGENSNSNEEVCLASADDLVGEGFNTLSVVLRPSDKQGEAMDRGTTSGTLPDMQTCCSGGSSRAVQTMPASLTNNWLLLGGKDVLATTDAASGRIPRR